MIAPDSRSLMPLILNYPNKFPNVPIVHHGIKRASHAIRSGKWKLIDSPIPQLFNLQTDLEEKNDIYQKHQPLVHNLKRKLDEIVKNVENREKLTDFGRLKIC